MKLLLALVGVLPVLLQLQAKHFICPIKDIRRTGCNGIRDCLYADPKSCKNYIECVIDNDHPNGNPVNKTCKGKLLWNNHRKTCDFPTSATGDNCTDSDSSCTNHNHYCCRAVGLGLGFGCNRIDPSLPPSHCRYVPACCPNWNLDGKCTDVSVL